MISASSVVKPRHVKVLFAFVVACLLMSSLLQRYVGNIMTDPDVDFYDYYFASKLLTGNSHADLYEGAIGGSAQLRRAARNSQMDLIAKASGFGGTNLYLYPPLLADLLIPLAKLPPHAAAALWRVLNLCFVLLSALILARFCQLRVISSEFVVLAVCAFAFWPIHESLSVGQVSIAMFLLWTVSIYAYYKGHILLSCAALALATMLKVTPLFALPVFLLWREWKWIAGYCATSAAALLGLAGLNGLNNLNSMSKVISGMGSSIPPNIQNKSISAMFAWLYYRKIFTHEGATDLVAAGQPHTLIVAAKLASFSVYALCLYFVWRHRKSVSRLNRASTLAVFAIVSIAISPVSWRHGYSAAFILLAILWVYSLRGSLRLGRAFLLALTTIAVGSFSFDLAERWHLPMPIVILCSSVWVISSLLLAVEVLWHGTEPREDNGADTLVPLEGPRSYLTS